MIDSPFSTLGIADALVQTLLNLGYEAPTPIQERTIPALLAGRDLIGQAQTGTGKTAAFALPIIQQLDPNKRETQALILAPTRELAVQVAEALHSYAHGIKSVTVLPVYGGAPIGPQIRRLERGVQVVVGTPGRLIDVLDRGSLRLDTVRMLVLDEADEMLKMGFIDDVERILSAAATPRQIALFSATMPPEVLRIAQRHLVNPEKIEIERKSVAAPAIEQRFINISESQKLDALTHLLEVEEKDAVLIFRRTKNGAAELAERLEGRGFAAVAMHGDMKQSERESVIRRLRAGQVEIVVATDVAARGLDVEQIAHVVNYDVPHDVESYVHRIGRTGRAGRTGVATLFVTPRERRMMRDIERFTGSAMKPMKTPTRADIAAKRVAQLKDSIRKTIGDGDLDMYLQLVEQLVEEGQHDIAEVAAAAARLASAARPIADVPAGVTFEEPPPRAYERAPRPTTAGADRPPRSDYAPRPDFTPRDDFAPRDEARPVRVPRTDGVRLRMDIGRADGIRPADVVGSIANEADIPGRDIGPIEIREEVTYVTVPAEAAEHVMRSTAHAKFRGRPVNLRVAGTEEEERAAPPRREFKPREGVARDYKPRGDRPPYKPREGGAREYKPRDVGPRDYKPRDAAPRDYKPRDAAPRDYKPREYKPRDAAPGREYKPRDAGARDYKPRTARPGEKPRTSAPRDAKGRSGPKFPGFGDRGKRR